MPVEMEQLRVLVLIAGLLLVHGCERKDAGCPPAQATAGRPCPLLYQRSDSVGDALAFIEVPEDRRIALLASVSKRGELADPQQLVFANKLLRVRESRDVELFKSLLSNETRKQLDGPDDHRQMVHYHLREVENGTFLDGPGDFKFFATVRTLTHDDLDMLTRNASFALTPTHVITFCHFHKPKKMLIGTCFYLIQDADSFRVVTETLPKGELPSAEKEPGAAWGQSLISD